MLLRKPSNHKMKSRKSRRKSFSFWLYIIGVFAMRETEAAHHSHEILFTAVGTSKTLLSFTMVSFLDDVEIAFYDKKHQQLVIKEAWVSHVLGADFIEDQQYKLMHNEIDYLWALQNWVQNDTLGKKNHTVQIWHNCHLERDIHVSSRIWCAVDGEDFCQMDEQISHWVAKKPEAEPAVLLAEEIYCSKKVKRYLEDYCVQPMRKVLQYSNIRDNVPPEVTVSWHHAPDGNVTLSCTATGFYPSSILLHWEKDKQLVVWGQESSSGILPNIDVTFYLQITLKLQSRDMEPGYTCVVEHSELETPAMYHVPVKPAKVGPWYMTLSILAVVTMLLSCAAAFITWKKRKTESTFSGSPGSANK
ncbi:zinc-alpha-2-glycoprotein-like isoform X1 [Phascolarctos cinereus]|uniref:Zinc-alpha-2-glycoprotein-like isoform X1 n=1 Tax=Phascolarctos cinereus TaxID=38626 RepID=A0A6P5LLU2_PHACI|nr:zinc-alpha-2-glycoprotein-like isoform X1 [Phascolarctos cinereus]